MFWALPRWKTMGWLASACTTSTWRTMRCTDTLPGCSLSYCTCDLDFFDIQPSKHPTTVHCIEWIVGEQPLVLMAWCTKGFSLVYTYIVPAWPVPWSIVHGCSWQILTAAFWEVLRGMWEPLGGHDDINEHFTKDKFQCNCINPIVHGHVNFQDLEISMARE